MPKIDLYRKIDEKYCSKRNADIRVGIPSLQYRNELDEMVQLPIDEEAEEKIELNEIEKGWLPEEYDLRPVPPQEQEMPVPGQQPISFLL